MPKLPPPPCRAQNRSGCSFSGRPYRLAVGGDHLGGQQVVARQPELAVQPAGSTAEGEPANTRRRDPATGRSQPVRLAGPVQVAHRRAATDHSRPCFRVDLDRIHPAKVDDHAAVGQRHPGDAVPATPHGHLQAAFSERISARTTSELPRTGRSLRVVGRSSS